MNEGGLRLVPNPAADKTLNIFLPEMPSMSCSIAVTNITGKKIFEKKIIKELSSDFISLSNLPFEGDGLYFLTAEIDGIIYSQKFQVGSR